jgi:hemerythrin
VWKVTNNQDYVFLQDRSTLGIPVIDRQHINLKRITGNLQFASLKAAEIANFRFLMAVHEAVDCVKHHFDTEEKLMNILEFPEYLGHKKEHDNFIWEIINRSESFQDGQSFDPQEFVSFFGDWLEFHIAASDKIFADFFQNMKHHGKLKRILSCDPELSAKIA